MKLRVIVATLLMIIPFSMYAQMEQLKGKLINKETGEPVPFANVVLPGTTHGTSTDSDGYFSIGYTDLMKELSFKISAVGFETVDIPIGGAVEAASHGELLVYIRPMVYTVGDVDVFGKSMVYRKLLRQAVDAIPDNYIIQPYNYVGSFVEKSITPNTEHFRNTQVVIYNKVGYKRMSAPELYQSESYRFNSAERSFKPVSAYDALTLMDEILSADIIKAPRNVLDESVNDEYTFSDNGIVELDGRKIQVIGFNVPEPNAANVYYSNVKSCKGEIYVDTLNKAVVKYTLSCELDGTNYLGYNYVANNNAPTQMDLVVTYKPYEGRYILGVVSISAGNKRLEYITEAVETVNIEEIEGRQYIER